MAWSYCDKCGLATDEAVLWEVKILRSPHSLAEYEWRCLRPTCAPPEERDEAHERAAQRYDGDGKDWR